MDLTVLSSPEPSFHRQYSKLFREHNPSFDLIFVGIRGLIGNLYIAHLLGIAVNDPMALGLRYEGFRIMRQAVRGKLTPEYRTMLADHGVSNVFLEVLDTAEYLYPRGQMADYMGIPYTVGNYEIRKEIPEQVRILFNLAIYAGLRKGEILALEFSDIDFDANAVSVTKAATVVKGKQVCKKPKMKMSTRTVTIPHELTLRILELRKSREQLKVDLGDFWQGGDCFPFRLGISHHVLQCKLKHLNMDGSLAACYFYLL